MLVTDRTDRLQSVDKPWLRFYSAESSTEELPRKTLYEYLVDNNKDNLDDIALIYFNKQITYKELFENIDRVELSLVGIGVKPGDIVTVAMPNTPEVVYTVYALNKLRAVANMIHPLASANEIVNYLNEVNSEYFIMFSGTYQLVKDYLAKTNVKKAVVAYPTESLGKFANFLAGRKEKIKFDEKIISWATFLKKGANAQLPANVAVDCFSMSIMSHTGGTTGFPKCVMLSDYSEISVVWQVGKSIEHKRQEIMLVCLPPFVNYSLTNGIFEPLSFGFKVVLIPDYKAEKFGEYVEKYRFNHINSIPAYWEALINIKGIEKVDMSSLSHIYYGGDAMNPQLEKDVNDLLHRCGAKTDIAKGYGATEMTSAVTVAFSECNEPGCIGIPLPKMICKIVDPEDYSEKTYMKEGEICFSGPSIMQGYYHNEEATNDMIKTHADGNRWLHTGDLGYVTEEGVIYITGRIKRLMITKGSDGNITKLFPVRVEKTIYEHSAVESCCVIGIKDEQRINILKAFVVLKPEYEESDLIRSELRELCINNLPDYMRPKWIEFREELPRTSRGKVDYKKLEEIENGD